MKFSGIHQYKLKEVLDFVVDNRGKTPSVIESGYPLLEINSVSPTRKYPRYTEVSKFLDENTFNTFFRTGHPAVGDILIPTVGTLGAVAYVDKEDCSIAQNLIAIRANDNLCDKNFLYYLLCDPTTRRRLLNLDIGAVQPSIKVPHLMSLRILLPKLEEQKKVSKILSDMDEKIENNDLIMEIYHKTIKNFFKEWFIDKSNESWPRVKLGDYIKLSRGLSYKGKFLSESNQDTAMLNLGNILPDSKFRIEKMKYYSGEYKEKHVVRPGDILVANTDLTQDRLVLGSAIMVPKLKIESMICTHHISIVKEYTISKYFLLGLLNSPKYRERVIGFATGTTVLGLPDETILNYEFNLPPKDLIQRYEKLVSPIYEAIDEKRLETYSLIELRDSLVARFMSQISEDYEKQ